MDHPKTEAGLRARIETLTTLMRTELAQLKETTDQLKETNAKLKESVDELRSKPRTPD
jgi:FtsZ-binding cell division protein ZapB